MIKPNKTKLLCFYCFDDICSKKVNLTSSHLLMQANSHYFAIIEQVFYFTFKSEVSGFLFCYNLFFWPISNYMDNVVSSICNGRDNLDRKDY